MSTLSNTVLLVTPGGRSAPGGIARMVDYCARAWPQSSPFKLHIIDSYGPGTKLLMPFYALTGFITAAWLLATGQVCLMHVNLSERLSLWRKGAFILLAGWFKVPAVIHMHGAEFTDYIHSTPARKRFAGRLLARADKIIVLGSYWRGFLMQEMEIAADKIVVLCNGVPDMGSKITRSAREECRIVFLGVLSERKGVSTLLRALAQPDMEQLNYKAIVAGNGAIEPYKKMATVLGISAKVEFPGLLSETQMRDTLGQADIFVLPSRREGLPMAILEAMSYGCPVVATSVGSIPDAVIDKQTGLLVPIDDAPALASALIRLIMDSETRKRLGAQGRALFEEKFSLTAYNKALDTIYGDVTGLRG